MPEVAYCDTWSSGKVFIRGGSNDTLSHSPMTTVLSSAQLLKAAAAAAYQKPSSAANMPSKTIALVSGQAANTSGHIGYGMY